MKKIRISKLLLLLFTAVILMSTNVNAKREEININGTKYNWCSTNGNSDGEKSNMNAIKKKSTIITSSDMKQEHPDVIYTPKFYIPGAGYYIYDSNNKQKTKSTKEGYYSFPSKNSAETAKTTAYYLRDEGNKKCVYAIAKVEILEKCDNFNQSQRKLRDKINIENFKHEVNKKEGTVTFSYQKVEGYKVILYYSGRKGGWNKKTNCGDTQCTINITNSSSSDNKKMKYSIVYVKDVDNKDNCHNVHFYAKTGSMPRLKSNSDYRSICEKNGYYKLEDLYQTIGRCNKQWINATHKVTSGKKQSLKTRINRMKNLQKRLKEKKEIGNKELEKYLNNRSLLSKTHELANNDGFYCKFNKQKNIIETKPFTVEVPINDYYEMVCQETLTGNYDTPKLVPHNGGGFEYNVDLKHNLTCYARIKKEKIKELSQIVECDTLTEAEESTEPDKAKSTAGPSEDFDICIKSCDKGNYTQKCINKCAKQTKTYVTTSLENNANVVRMFKSDGYSRKTLEDKELEETPKFSTTWCRHPDSNDEVKDWHCTASGTSTTDQSKYDPSGRYFHTTESGYKNCVAYRCVVAWDENGKKRNIGKMAATSGCSKNKAVYLANPDSGYEVGYAILNYDNDDNNEAAYRITENTKEQSEDLKIDADGKANDKEGKLNCYVAPVEDGDNSVWEKKVKEIEDAYEAAENKYKAKMEELSLDAIKMQYHIQDSTESFCSDAKTYTFSNIADKDSYKLSVTENSRTEEKGSNDIIKSKTVSYTTGFPNSCLTDGKTTYKKGCCNPDTEGVSGGNRFYMDITEELNINNVYMWPVGDNANFNALEKDTISKARKQVETNLNGLKLKVWDADEYSNKDSKHTEGSACKVGKYRFTYNIKANAINVGVLGKEDDRWNIDINCFYGYYNPIIASCHTERNLVDTDGDGKEDAVIIDQTLCKDDDTSGSGGTKHRQVSTLVDNYIYRTIDLTDPFNGDKVLPWNWQDSKTTDAATNNLAARKIDYVISPSKTIDLIKERKYTIYDGDDKRNYHFYISSDNMKKIRDYNTKNSVIGDCNSRKIGCSNKFITNNTYFKETSGSQGIYNQKGLTK